MEYLGNEPRPPKLTSGHIRCDHHRRQWLFVIRHHERSAASTEHERHRNPRECQLLWRRQWRHQPDGIGHRPSFFLCLEQRRYNRRYCQFSAGCIRRYHHRSVGLYLATVGEHHPTDFPNQCTSSHNRCCLLQRTNRCN